MVLYRYIVKFKVWANFEIQFTHQHNINPCQRMTIVLLFIFSCKKKSFNNEGKLKTQIAIMIKLSQTFYAFYKNKSVAISIPTHKNLYRTSFARKLRFKFKSAEKFLVQIRFRGSSFWFRIQKGASSRISIIR